MKLEMDAKRIVILVGAALIILLVLVQIFRESGYDFTITEPANITFNYDVVARLEIVDPVDKQVYYEKEYTLLENQQATIDQKQQYYINQPISIDYNYYNSLANSFKSTYGVDSESNLVVYLKINKNNTNDTDLIKISNQSNMVQQGGPILSVANDKPVKLLIVIKMPLRTHGNFV